MEFLWAVDFFSPQHHSPPNEVKERGGGLFEDTIPYTLVYILEAFQCDMLLGLKE